MSYMYYLILKSKSSFSLCCHSLYAIARFSEQTDNESLMEVKRDFLSITEVAAYAENALF